MGLLVVAELFISLAIVLWGFAQGKTFGQIFSRVFIGALLTVGIVLCFMIFLFPSAEKYPIVSDTTILLSDSDFVDTPEYFVKSDGDITVQLHKSLRSKFDHVYFAEGPAYIRIIVRHLPTSFLLLPETYTTTDLYLPNVYRSVKRVGVRL